MTNPGGQTPDGTLGADLSALDGLDEATWKANLRADKLSGYDEAHATWNETFDEWGNKVDTLRDGQFDLTDRVETLDGARGYCCVFMSRNWNVNGNKWITLPFDSQLGPRIDANPSGGNAIAFVGAGLWRCDLHVTFYPPPSGWFGSTQFVLAQVAIVVMSGASVYSRKTFDTVITSAGAESTAFSHTFVLPSAGGYSVHAEVKHQQSSAWMYGGTERSALSANKWSTGTANAVVLSTVPDGGTLS